MLASLQKFSRIVLTGLLLILTCNNAAIASQRIALVIGNSTYQDGRLKNPVNDAADIAQSLSNKGFEVTKILNADKRQMKRAINQFTQGIYTRDTVGLFYFAGHGMEVNGQNYLIPVDADIQSGADVEYEAVNAGRLLSGMREAGNGLNLVILDACRNNPYNRSSRSATRGLTRMSPPSGSLVLYATEPGSIAEDGEGRNGTFTRYLLEAMEQPGITVEQAFKRTAINVRNATDARQTPWFEGVILGDFYFKSSTGSVENQVALMDINKTSATAPAIGENKPVSQSTTSSQNPEFMVDVSGTYISEISLSASRGQIIPKKYRKMEITLEQIGNTISGIDSSGKYEFKGTREGSVINFFLLGFKNSGVWVINADASKLEGKWNTNTYGGAWGKWNLTRVGPSATTQQQLQKNAGKDLEALQDKLKSATNPVVTLSTNKGDIVLELFVEEAAQSVRNFLEYVDSGFYADTIFHRVIPDFMIQGGGFTENMQKKPSGLDAVENEADNGLKNQRGALAMARTSDPHSATSQFFINTKDNDFLDFKAKDKSGWGYTVFGRVIEGMDVVEAIEESSTTTKSNHRDVPKQAVIIESVSQSQ